MADETRSGWPKMMRSWWFRLIAIAGLGWLTIWGSTELLRTLSRLEPIPADLEPVWVDYAKFEELGFGPGGDEYWLYIYGMSDGAAERIAREGVSFFYRQENIDKRRGEQRDFSEWRPTPMLIGSPGWGNYPPVGTAIPLNLERFNYGGEGVWPFPSEVAQLANAIFAEEGAFYSRVDDLVIIVSPTRRKILYFHVRLMPTALS